MSAGVATRVAAARVLDDVLHRGRSLKASLGTALPALADPRDRALVEAIVFAALRQRARFDAALAQWLSKPLGQRDHELRALLHAGFAQLTLGMPGHAVLDATVEAARALRRPHQAGMVNAVLRRAQREGLPPAAHGDAWPDWLARRIRADWPQSAAAIFEASAEEAPMWLRVHARATTRGGYLARLHEAGIAAAVDEDLPDAICLDTSLPVQQLPGFDDGVVSVQDGAAQRVADALAPKPRARVLDACAAPGGKSAHLAERDPSLRITALDVDPRRVRRMQETFARLKLDIDARSADAMQSAGWWDGVPFDAILLDAPCSASGIVRRHPDVRWLRRASDIAALAQTQARLLDALWPLLAPGGRLLYCTCSVFKAEGEDQIDAFLQRRAAAADALRLSAPGHLLPLADNRRPDDVRLEGVPASDGFFYALLEKRALR